MSKRFTKLPISKNNKESIDEKENIEYKENSCDKYGVIIHQETVEKNVLELEKTNKQKTINLNKILEDDKEIEDIKSKKENIFVCFLSNIFIFFESLFDGRERVYLTLKSFIKVVFLTNLILFLLFEFIIPMGKDITNKITQDKTYNNITKDDNPFSWNTTDVINMSKLFNEKYDF